MYLNLGAAILPHEDILGIFDLDAVTLSHISRDFLREAQQQDRVRDTGGGYDLPKSFVLTGDEVLLSPLSSATLQKRCNSPKGVL